MITLFSKIKLALGAAFSLALVGFGYRLKGNMTAKETLKATLKTQAKAKEAQSEANLKKSTAYDANIVERLDEL